MKDQLSTTSTQNTIASRYKNPVVKELALLLTNAAMQAVPVIGSPVAALIFGGISLAKERRAQVYLDELEQKLHELDEDAVSREEFTHLFTVTARSALNTQQNEKIKRFARLFASFANGSKFELVDEYEEYAQILIEVSEREFQVLLLLNRMRFYKPSEFIPIVSVLGENVPSEEVQHSEHAQAVSKQNQDIISMWKPFLWTAQGQLGISSQEMPGILERLKRTGLYQAMIYQAILGTEIEGDIGYLTPNFHTLLKALQTEDAGA